MNPLPVGPFEWWWAWAGVGLTVVASCSLIPWIVLEELARQERDSSNVVQFRKRA